MEIGRAGLVRMRNANKNPAPPNTADPDYTQRLISLQSAWWKRFLDVQAPYRRHLQRLKLGRTLDVGCGIGRNLAFLDDGSVGVDHNPHSIFVAQQRGLSAMLPEEFINTYPSAAPAFDALLLAHVVEHMNFIAACKLLSDYLPRLKSRGRVVLIAPQEAGFRSDATHVEFFDFKQLEHLLTCCGLCFAKAYSFPFPRWVGRVFKYNEFVTIGEKT